MFIGRWQPWHEGHKWLINQRLKEGKNVLICIRDMETDENNPWTPRQVQQTLENVFEQDDRVKIMIIPDIESVNYGRGVGYDVIEHVPPSTIKEISATKIRKEMRKDNEN